MPMFNDMDWTRNGSAELCLHDATEVTALATTLKRGHWCFLVLVSDKTWWNGNSNAPQGQRDSIALQMVDIFKCHTSHPLSLRQVMKGGADYHFQGTMWEQEEILIKTVLAGNFLCIYSCCCQWYDTEKHGTYTEKIRRREANRPQHRAVDINYAKKERNMSQARGDSMVKLTAHRES